MNLTNGNAAANVCLGKENYLADLLKKKATMTKINLVLK